MNNHPLNNTRQNNQQLVPLDFNKSHISPSKKSSYNVTSTTEQPKNTQQVERITINMPNPLLMPNASVQV